MSASEKRGVVNGTTGDSMAAVDRAALLADYRRLVSAARLAELEALGLNVVVPARDGGRTFDIDGRGYLDCIGGAGVFNLGRRPAALVEALREAARATDQGNFPLISREKAELAEHLSRFAPGDLDCAVFSVSRGEAFDFACKLARGVTGRPRLVAAQGSWFGQTGFALALSERPDAAQFGPLIPETVTVPFNDLAAAEEVIDESTAAFCLEPVQAENGCRAADPRYLRSLTRICRDRGALLVLDETQTGLGRCGLRFAYGRSGAVPDVLVVGESLAAGMFPICATLYRAEFNRFLDAHPLIHLSTFGGSDVGCTVGRRALQEYERLRPWENAAVMGERLLAGLTAVAAANKRKVKAVDGVGLLLALDLGTTGAAAAFCKRLAAAGVLAMPGAVARHSVVLRPSLLVTAAEVDAIVAAVTEALAGGRAREMSE
jgi:putrescine aminotransferase